jgi:lipoprotein-anchoring transpeptidase ErfK/SrfK
MKPVVVLFTAALAASAASGGAMAQAVYGHPGREKPLAPQPAPASGYGGGFIEMLMTGAAPQTAPLRPAQVSASGRLLPTAPYGVDPFGEPSQPTRVASLPQGGDPSVGIPRALPPQYRRQEVEYTGRHAPGTIIIDTPEKYLYLVQPGGRAIRYGIGVGRPGFEWAGMKTVSMKREWPDWTPPAQMLKRRPDLPRHMEGGPDNPLGARALYLGSSLYRIHGTNEPNTIGLALSSGCIRMLNEDVIDLYNRVRVGTRVLVI